MGSRLEAKSAEVRKRIEGHTFESENGEEYTGSKFGGYADYFRRKKIKLQNLDVDIRQSSGNRPAVFKNVVAHVNGYTQPSLSDLHHLIVSYGGSFIQYLDGKTMVTHIIASNLTPKKKVEFSRYRIVKPAWVVDSIEAGRLLPWESYRVIEEVPGQKILGFDKGVVTSQISSRSQGYRDQTDKSWYTDHVRDIALQIDKAQSKAPVSDGHGSGVRRDRDSEGELVSADSGKDPATGRVSDEEGSGSAKEAEAEATRSQRLGLIDTSEAYDSPVPKSASPSHRHTALVDHDPEAEQSVAAPTNPALSGKDPAEHDSASERFSEDESDFEDLLSATEVGAGFPQDRDRSLNRAGNIESTETLSQDANVGPKDGRSHGTKTGSTIHTISPEEHNALLLADPKVWKSTVVNPGFLKQYYEESRLHHLSAWKAALKSQLQAQAAERTSSQKARSKKLPGTRRYILHVDFDSFFAAVSLRKSPQHIDKPVVVAHGNGSGAEIASCNYPARKFGIKNGMWMKNAQKLCPDLKVLPYDFKAYEEASKSFYDTIMSTGGIVQSVSIDEALVDVSNQCIQASGHDGRAVHEGSIWREQAKAENIAQEIRDQVKTRTGCAVSVGIGGNILLAKVALRKAKPAGQFHVKPDEALQYLGNLTMQELPGIAYSIGGKLEEIGVKYVQDVRQLTKERLMSVLGPKTGEKIWDYSRGIDNAEVGDQVVRKSVSAEVNWGIRFVTQDQVDEFMNSLCEEVRNRLLLEGVKGRQLTMKIMRRAADAPLDPPKHLGHGKCDTYNKSVMLGVTTNDTSVLCREALSILKGFGFTPGELRGLGLQVQKLEPMKLNPGRHVDGSQKKLQFSTTTPKKRLLSSVDFPAENIDSPKKLHEHLTPTPAIPFAINTDSGDRRNAPLNISGTQFLLPSQVDPAVLNELPEDLRLKLFPPASSKSKLRTEQNDSRGPLDHDAATRSHQDPGPIQTSQEDLLDYEKISASQKQIDLETLKALPADVRADILSHYAIRPNQSRRQAVLPQSPRKDRTIRLPKKLTTPTKRRGRPLGGGGFRAVAAAHSTLTQSNFVPNPKTTTSKDAVAAISDGFALDDVSPEFLSALPEDIRDEVVAQARRERLQKKAGLDVTAKRKRAAPVKELPRGQRTLQLPPRPSKPTFTAKAYSTIEDLRSAMEAWYSAFETEMPDDEDTDALIAYLKRVVIDEGDMEKAVNVVNWLRWVIEKAGEPATAWRGALQKVEGGVQEAVHSRGLGRVQF